MKSLVLTWGIHSLSLYLVAMLLPQIHVDSFLQAVLASGVIGFLNVLVKPILVLFTLPVTMITLGVFLFVINALILLLASAITPGFSVDGIGTALAGSILMTIFSIILRGLTHEH